MLPLFKGRGRYTYDPPSKKNITTTVSMRFRKTRRVRITSHYRNEKIKMDYECTLTIVCKNYKSIKRFDRFLSSLTRKKNLKTKKTSIKRRLVRNYRRPTCSPFTKSLLLLLLLVNVGVFGFFIIKCFIYFLSPYSRRYDVRLMRA